MFKAIALTALIAFAGWHYTINPVQHSEGTPSDAPTIDSINPVQHSEGTPTESANSKGINPIQHSE